MATGTIPICRFVDLLDKYKFSNSFLKPNTIEALPLFHLYGSETAPIGIRFNNQIRPSNLHID